MAVDLIIQVEYTKNAIGGGTQPHFLLKMGSTRGKPGLLGNRKLRGGVIFVLQTCRHESACVTNSGSDSYLFS